jgi:hypothetical protein
MYWTRSNRGCQIFLGATNQNWKNVPNIYKIYQKAANYTKWQLKGPKGYKM